MSISYRVEYQPNPTNSALNSEYEKAATVNDTNQIFTSA